MSLLEFIPYIFDNITYFIISYKTQIKTRDFIYCIRPAIPLKKNDTHQTLRFYEFLEKEGV